ncbi:MAG: AMP-binding protein, partial [Actinomycetota bacterium]
DVDALLAACGPVAEATGRVAPSAVDEAAVLFTSGATGPAKGVRYTHGQLAAQRDALSTTYRIAPDDRLVAAFAPFALYGPALGISTALPDCDVTAPGSLTAGALSAAVERIDATMVFASPAALTNVVATAAQLSHGAFHGVRTLMSAGAPVPSELLTTVSELVRNATLHTPYGMTETLPVADVDLDTILAAESAAPAAGVCVGRPVEGAEVLVVPLGFDPVEGVPDAVQVGQMGELLVRAPWRSDGYVGLWATQRAARPGGGWHRTGDVGHLDDQGLLWVEGRAVHVVHTADGPLSSVPVERAVEAAGVDGVRSGRVAAVGVGPVGVQQLVVVIERPDDRRGLASPELAGAVRSAVPVPVAAVFVDPSLPVDIRHNAKIDRLAVARWVGRSLAGTDD